MNSPPPNPSLRAILPKPSHGAPPALSAALSGRVLPPKRKGITAACEDCRRRKAKVTSLILPCLGAPLRLTWVDIIVRWRPAKMRKLTARDQECEYVNNPDETRHTALQRTYQETKTELKELRDSHNTLNQLFQALKSRDVADASAILQRIRESDDLKGIAHDLSIGPLAEPSDSAQAPSTDVSRPARGSKRKRASDPGPYAELFNLLKSMSDSESLGILDRARQGDDISDIVRQVKDGNLLLQLSLVPEVRRHYEFPYLPGFPSFLKDRHNPYLQALFYDTAATGATPSGIHLQSSASVASIDCAEQAPYLTPYSAAEIVDPNLWNVTTKKWTSVIHDDHLLRKLLHSYFLNQYPTFFPFQKDYFLQDMASGRQRFCSPLLVNAILAAACRSYNEIQDRVKFWIPQNLAYRFFAEAKRLWELQIGQSSLTAIQAAVVLNTVSNGDAMDRVGRMYMLQAAAMAHDIDLFTSSADIKSTKMRRAREFTAWGLLCWDSMESFYFHREPLFKLPPTVFPPDPAEDATWYGEIWVRYPLNTSLSRTHFGMNTKAMMDLRFILFEIAHAYFGSSNSDRSVPAADQVLWFRSRLDAWFHSLPGPLTHTKIMLPSHLKTHMEYYTTLIMLAQSQSASQVELPEPYADKTPSEVISEAYANLETLVRVYHRRHSFESSDVFMVNFLVFLSGATLERLATDCPAQLRENYRSTLILCVKALHAQGTSTYICHVSYYVLRNRMSDQDRDLLLTYVKETPNEDEDLIAKHTRANWVMPIIRLHDDTKTAVLDNVLKEYEKLSLESGESDGSALDF